MSQMGSLPSKTNNGSVAVLVDALNNKELFLEKSKQVDDSNGNLTNQKGNIPISVSDDKTDDRHTEVETRASKKSDSPEHSKHKTKHRRRRKHKDKRASPDLEKQDNQKETVDEAVVEAVDRTVDEAVDGPVVEAVDRTVDRTVDEAVDGPVDGAVDETDVKADETSGSELENRFQIYLEKLLESLKSHTTTIKNTFNKADISTVNKVIPSLDFIHNSFYEFSITQFSLEEVRLARNKLALVLAEEKVIDDLCQISMFLNNENYEVSAIFHIYKLCIGCLLNTSSVTAVVGGQICTSDGFLEWIKKTLTVWYKPHMVKKLEGKFLSIIDDLISIIHNCCMLNANAIPHVRALNFVVLLEKYLDTPYGLIRVAAIAALADILEEKECGILKSNKTVVRVFINVLQNATTTTERDCFGWEVVELVRTLGQLAKIDANKTLLSENGALDVLSELTSSTFPEEQKEALNTIGHLAFDDDIQESMVNGKYQTLVDTLIELNQSSTDGIREAAYGVLWTLSDRLKKSDKYHKIVSEIFKKKSRGHIMISYSSDQRQELMKIKSRIESVGYVVWMDVEQMREDIYDRMAEAVMKAAVVLLCMSRRYKQSKYCRQEARFADRLNKQIIPLKMENNYDADGWLDLMTAGITFYDFSGKYEFEIPIEKLIKELQNHAYKGTTGHVAQITCSEIPGEPLQIAQHGVVESIPSFRPTKKTEEVKKWTKQQMLAWLEKHSLNTKKCAEMRPKDIVFLANMKEQSPAVYYKTMESLFDTDNKFSTVQLMADFTEALDEVTS